MIYIVDDDSSVRKAVSRLMQSENLLARTFDSAESFLDAVRPLPGDCLLLDLQLPGMDGIELQRHLIRSGVPVPVIFITAFDDDQSRRAARELGAAGYFQKPLDDRALLDAIKFAGTAIAG